MTATMALFWMTAAADTEDLLADDQKILFNDPAVSRFPNRCYKVQPRDARSIPDNKVPFFERTEKQDAGFAGTGITLYLRFYEGAVDSMGNRAQNAGFQRLLSWARQKNTVPGVFRRGRVGLRMDIRPEYDIVPTVDRGYLIADVAVEYEFRYKNIVDVTARLLNAGDPPAV